MKAAYLTGKQKIEILETEKPKIERPIDVLIKIKSVGVCGSDRHYFIDGNIGRQVIKYPHIIGHECAGMVEEVGSAVTEVKVGDRVAVDPAIACGKCYYCIHGQQNFCLNLVFLSVPGEIEGCMKEYLVMPQENAILLDSRLSFEDGAMLEPLGICLYAVEQYGVSGGDAVAILGSGPIGLLTMQTAKACGASTAFATDRVSERVDMARRLGADYSGNPDETDVVGEIMERTAGFGVDVAFECAGEQETMDQCIEIAKKGGAIVVIGIHSPEVILNVNSEQIRRKGLTIKGIRRQVHQMEPAMRMVAAGQIDVRTMVTHRAPLERSDEIYEKIAYYKDGAVKAMINLG